MWIYSMQDELYHFGVKGMKWGVIRKRNTSSTGNKDETNPKKKLSTGQKVAIAVGTTAVIAAGVYFANKYRSMNADAVIKKGKEFQHMGRLSEDLSKPFYASHLKSDNRAYAKNNFFGSSWTTQKTMVSNKDLKIAGKKVTLDTFSDWVNTSPVAKEKFAGLDTSKKNNVKSAYYKFNKNLSSPDMRDKTMFNDFYSRLSDRGYDAIRDMNDQVNSGIKSPILVFGSLSDIMTKKVSEL